MQLRGHGHGLCIFMYEYIMYQSLLCSHVVTATVPEYYCIFSNMVTATVTEYLIFEQHSHGNGHGLCIFGNMVTRSGASCCCADDDDDDDHDDAKYLPCYRCRVLHAPTIPCTIHVYIYMSRVEACSRKVCMVHKKERQRNIFTACDRPRMEETHTDKQTYA
jgi:hypothetical protein